MKVLFVIFVALLTPGIAALASASSPSTLLAQGDWSKVNPSGGGDTHLPIPPAPPPPPPPRAFVVFFDWDQANITPEGMQVIREVAAQYRAGGAVQLQVTGYTDLKGAPGNNLRLSERRANSVASALNRLGVPSIDLLVSGRGSNDPRVPTPSGVRQPQNDRVEIVFP
jgi:outer membrane protein OmpA-like peptidoglycan-associated protein